MQEGARKAGGRGMEWDEVICIMLATDFQSHLRNFCLDHPRGNSINLSCVD